MYLDKNKKITIFFEKNSYELIGWLIEDEFQNEIFFSIKIKKTNTQIEEKEFKIPSISKESN
jgi:outer membrane lipoprotein-sorting protein